MWFDKDTFPKFLMYSFVIIYCTNSKYDFYFFYLGILRYRKLTVLKCLPFQVTITTKLY